MKRKIVKVFPLSLAILILFGVIYTRQWVVINEVIHTFERKVYIPESAQKKEYSWNEICTYFGKDVSLGKLPEEYDNNIENQTYFMYVDSEGQVVYDNVELLYSKAQGYIRIIVSKEKMPLEDEKMMEGKNSWILGKKFKLYKNDNTYETEFINREIGYKVVAQNVDKKEFIDIIKQIIK